MINKLLRYLVNTIIFIVLWGVLFLPVMKYSIDMGATSIAAIGGIISIIISYKLVKRINKSNLWSRLFDENVAINDITEDKADIIEENQKKKENNISELAGNLTKLNELKEKGILSEEEFNEQKRKLLKQ